MLRQQNNEIHLQLRLDVIALAPVGIFGLVINNDLYLLGKRDELILRIFKIILDGEGFQDVVEGLLFKIDAHIGEGFLLFSDGVIEVDDLIGEIFQHLTSEDILFAPVVVPLHQGFELFSKIHPLELIHLLELINGLGQQLLEQLDFGVGQFDLLRSWPGSPDQRYPPLWCRPDPS